VDAIKPMKEVAEKYKSADMFQSWEMLIINGTRKSSTMVW
jgi:hypothetical protein